MSSLIASQSTLCLQTRQDAVANEPGMGGKVIYKLSPGTEIKLTNSIIRTAAFTMTLDNPLNSRYLF